MSTSFTEAIQRQTTVMVALAKSLDERGYAVLPHHLNHDMRNDRPYGRMLMLVEKIAVEWAANAWRQRQRPVFIHVWPKFDKGRQDLEGEFDFTGSFMFQAIIPHRRALKPIIAALRLVGTEQKGRNWHDGPRGLLHATITSERVEITGIDRGAFECLLSILNTHREFLLRKE